VSLLLDALKRAEQEKLARGTEPQKAGRAPDTSGFDMESPRMAPLSAPVLELQPVEGGTAPSPAPGADAKAIQNAFAAKAAAAPSGRQRLVLWAGLAAIVVAVAAAGGYIWYSIQQLTPPPFNPRPRVRPPALALPPAASIEPSSAAKMEQLVALANGRPGAPAAAAAPAQPGPVAAASGTAVVKPLTAERALSAPQSGAQQALEEMLRDGQRLREGEPFSLQRSAETPRVPTQVTAGYEALTLGDLERARREYAGAVRTDPNNLDAQLGLATVEARSGHRALAASLYRKALEIDPRDPTALAGLAGLAASARPDGVEAQLRADLSRGDSPAVHFALGNLYASQGRWSDAQAEYFEAYRGDPGNPDIVFNLAVSLDHLAQAKLAAGYYERALEAAQRQSAQFDPASVARRLAELHAAAHP
jgi:Tfp pilus assembly protein PilF